MKNLVLYLLLMIAVPVVAQPGYPLIKAGHHAHPASHHNSSTHHKNLGMNPRDYEDAVRIINNETFDEKRLDAAKRIITANPMSTRQIVGICKLFTFEANKLDFAKYAYHRCVDPNKSFLLDEVFTFRSSKEELFEYIQKVQRP